MEIKVLGYKPTILDVIALNKLIPDQYILETRKALEKKLSSLEYPNLAIEEFLLARNYITQENLAKAYSILLNLPLVRLSQYEIPKEVISIVPEKIARLYGILAFYSEGGVIHIAVANPGLLKESHGGVIEKLAKEKGVLVKLYITTKDEFKEALNWYHWTRPIGRVRLYDRPINPLALKKIAKKDAESFRLLCFDNVPVLFGGRQYFRVATDLPRSRNLEKVIRFIERKNNVFISLYRTSTEDFNNVLKYYELLLSLPKEAWGLPFSEVLKKYAKPLPPPKPEIIPQERLVKAKLDTSFHLLDELINFLKNLFHSHPKQPLPVKEQIRVQTKTQAQKTPSKPEKSSVSVKSLPTPPQPPVVSREVVSSSVNENFSRYIIGKRGHKILNVKYAATKDQEKQAKLKEVKAFSSLLKKSITSLKELEDVAIAGNVPIIVAAIISYALFLEASDIHIESDDEKERVRYRIDGVLQDIIYLPVVIHPAVVSRIKILCNLKIDETRLPQDGRFDFSFQDREVDIRVSTFPTIYGEKVVMRLLDKNKGILTLEELGFAGKAYKDINEAIKKPYGIILATGPTGSGKSTTLYAILGKIAKPEVNVSTLEDPVEYEIAGVNQAQVKPQIGFTFAEGLRSLMRQDPNIIMVGEIRDLETAINATHAALTGHLVLSTLHTNDAAGALPRLIAMGVEPFLITSSINAIIAQRLVRKICKYCKEEVEIEHGLYLDVERELSAISPENKLDYARVKKPFRFYKGRGCDKCKGGYKGRIGIYEVLVPSEEIERLAVENAPASRILEQARREGMITMKQDGYLKAIAGITTIEEVLRETKID